MTAQRLRPSSSFPSASASGELPLLEPRQVRSERKLESLDALRQEEARRRVIEDGRPSRVGDNKNVCDVFAFLAQRDKVGRRPESRAVADEQLKKQRQRLTSQRRVSAFLCAPEVAASRLRWNIGQEAAAAHSAFAAAHSAELAKSLSSSAEPFKKPASTSSFLMLEVAGAAQAAAKKKAVYDAAAAERRAHMARLHEPTFPDVEEKKQAAAAQRAAKAGARAKRHAKEQKALDRSIQEATAERAMRRAMEAQRVADVARAGEEKRQAAAAKRGRMPVWGSACGGSTGAGSSSSSGHGSSPGGGAGRARTDADFEQLLVDQSLQLREALHKMETLEERVKRMQALLTDEERAALTPLPPRSLPPLS